MGEREREHRGWTPQPYLTGHKHQLWKSSGQDGGVGRNPSLPRTTKRRITTNLKSIKNQKCQKIKTGKAGRQRTPWQGWLREPVVRHQNTQAGLAEWENETQSWLWTTAQGCCDGRNSQSHRRVCWKEGLEWSRWAAFFLPWPLPHRQHHSTARRVPPPRGIPKALPPYNLTGVLRPRNMAQMKEHSKTPERELSDEEVANRSIR